MVRKVTNKLCAASTADTLANKDKSGGQITYCFFSKHTGEHGLELRINLVKPF